MTIDANYDYPRETSEYVFFEELLINGVIPSGDIQFNLTRGLDRPRDENWGEVVEQGGKKCFLLPPQAKAGKVKVWVRAVGVGEVPVIEAGFINIT